MLRRRLERASFGATDALGAEVEKAGGFEAWLDAQLAGKAPATSPATHALLDGIDARLPALTSLHFDQRERAEAARLSFQTITGRTVFGAAFAPDQLRQRVVDVLADHLHVSSTLQPELFGVCAYDTVLRDGAFGRFADLLVATARQPAMLAFLDQDSSRADHGRIPNENYAREVMELHTVGVDGGYDEGDVGELAHVLSGWSMDRRTNSYQFKANWHDLGPFAEQGDILGWRPSAGEVGEAAGVAALEHLAKHSATAHRLAHLFARRLVSETIAPDDPLVREAAALYQSHDTEIGPMVRHLLVSDRFATSATIMLRRPIDLVAHVLRTAGTPHTPDDLEPTLTLLAGLMNVLGQVPYGWPAPNGYPTASAAWANGGAMIGRWNAMVTLTEIGGTASQVGLQGQSALQLDPTALGAKTQADLVSRLCGPDHQVF